MGITEPVGASVDLLPLRALLVPALAVTQAGDRLGKGGGYYDRVLAVLAEARPPVVAIAGDTDVVDALPTDAHDQRVQMIVTPTGVIRCSWH
jgi:5-formyltetrahydrofolate cyclo-ligase